MTVKIINGDITMSNVDIIAHVVNCNFVMGAGVAKAIREKWPSVYEQYKEFGNKICGDKTRSLGKCQLVLFNEILKDQENNGIIPFRTRYVGNLFAEPSIYANGKKIDYIALEISLHELKRYAVYNLENIKSIGFPWLMGAGLAGGDWSVVKTMVERIFSDTDIDIVYYKFG